MEYGCIGETLKHSFSKEIHTQLMGYDYQLREVAKEDLAAFMTARDFKAINVTIPYKRDVIPFLDGMSDLAREVGVVNTIVNRGGKLYGDNTDFYGMRALAAHSGIEMRDKKVLILGSGGTSKTAAAVARQNGARAIYRVSRTGKDGCLTYEQAVDWHGDAEVILNTTPCGMYPKVGESPVKVSNFPQLEGLLDVIYNPLRTELVLEAREYGVNAIGGLYMLVMQAVAAAEIFTGTVVERDKAEQVYRNIRCAKQNIVLIGMPGSGKSTVGKALAAQLGMEYVDVDEEIVRETGKPIPAIFAEEGEGGFRDIESTIIEGLLPRQHTVIATGGGSILRPRNVRALKANGKLYFLDRSPDQLVATQDRPLSSTREDLMRRYEERYPLYCAAADVILNDIPTPQAAVDAVKEEFLR